MLSGLSSQSEHKDPEPWAAHHMRSMLAHLRVHHALAHQSKGRVSWDSLTQKSMPLVPTSSSPPGRDREQMGGCTCKMGEGQFLLSY